MLKKQILLCALFLSIVSQISYAVEPKNEIEEVIVTALRLNTTVEQSGSSLSIIDEELIRDRGYNFLADAIVSATGVTLNQNGSFGGQASVRIRGFSSDQTLVLIDGVPANDTTSPGGGFNFGALDALDVQRVEVLKGPQSTLWGTDAIGGVVNIVSKPAAENLSGKISILGGSFGSQRLSGTISSANDLGDFRVSYADVKTDGISKADEDDGNEEEDGFDSQTLSVKGGLNLGKAARLDVFYRNTDASTEFDSFGVVTGTQDGNERSDTDQTSTQATLNFNLFSGRLENTLTYGHTEIERKNFTDDVSSFSADGERTLFRYQGSFSISETQLLSVGYETEESESGNDDTTIDGAFALYRFEPSENVTLSFGVRRDDHDTYGSETVGRIAAAWQVSENLLLHSSWGEGFKAPTLFQTTFFCCGATSANTGLKAEYSDAYDVGMTYGFADGDALLSATYFDQNTQDLINFSFAVGGYENIAEVDSNGVELEFSYAFSDAWTVTTNLTYLDSEDGSGDEQVRLPEITADLALSWKPSEAIRSSLVVIYNDEEGDSRGTVDSWTRADLSASYQLSKNIELFARIENLFDEDYQQIFGYGTPERSGYIGARYQL
jgi:vitamin B12 transporter